MKVNLFLVTHFLFKHLFYFLSVIVSKVRGMLRGSSPCTDLSLVVRCDYVNERVNVKLALSFCTTWLNMVAACTALN